MSADGSQEEGWKVPLAQAVKTAVDIPVAAMGSLRHPDYVEQCIRDGKCDMIGIGRGLLADHEWVNKVKKGKKNRIRHCISCMHCFNYCPPGKAGCSVNPFALRENEKMELKKDGEGRVVAIVGAGPAGLEAAVTLAERGFSPVIFEKDGEIGGMVRFAQLLPGKQKYRWQIEYYMSEIERLSITLKLNTEATPEHIRALEPYAIIISTGATEVSPELRGIDQAKVFTVIDFLDDNSDIRDKAITIIGSGAQGLALGEMLTDMNNKVTVFDMKPPPEDIRSLTFEHRFALGKATSKGIEINYNREFVEVNHSGAFVRNLVDNEVITAPSDYVILSSGRQPNRKLYEKIKDSFQNVFVMGDAAEIGNIAEAVLAGSKLGYALQGKNG
jgi:thioredoxin reductase